MNLPIYAQQARNAVRLVVWHPRKGMERDFEVGYKRHLGWHQKAGDTWSWYGWTFVSGDRASDFMDGTLFHAWADFDAPVSPAADAADNRDNVLPYGDLAAVASYDSVPELSTATIAAFSLPLITVCHFRVRVGSERAFEMLLRPIIGPPQNSPTKKPSSLPALALLRPVSGTTEYLLILTGDKQADLPRHAELISKVEAAVNARQTILESVKTETLRYRADLSLIQ